MCPPGTDQTERSRQKWHILAPRRRKIHKLLHNNSPYSNYTPLEYLFNDKNSWNAWSKLARCATPSHTPAGRRSHCSITKRTTPLSRLESLPSELLTSIIEETALPKSDIIALGLTCEILWSHVLQHVEKDCSRTEAPMAGVEIACIGSYLTDLPGSFAKDELAKSSVEISEWGYMCEARKINWAATAHYSAVDVTPEEAWLTAWQVQHGCLAQFPVRAHRTMSAEFLARCSELRGSRSDALWVLRNLTTRVYVRCRPGEGLRELRGVVDCEDRRIKVRVEDVLLMRICWTRVRSRDDKRELGIFPGKWAGHRFDIVPWEQLNGAEGWRDCTAEMLEEAKVVAEKILPNDMAETVFPSEKASLRPKRGVKV